MAKDIGKFMLKIEDDATWDSIVEQSEQKLVIIDCHQEWCGYCEAIHPSMARVLLDYEGVEERLIYATASIGKVGVKMQASFPTDANINLEKNGCLPLFAVFRFKACIAVVVGVDSPTLLQHISTNMPAKPVKA